MKGVPSIKQVLPAERQKEYENFCSYSFCLLSGSSIIAFLREEGGTRSVTEGARVTLVFNKFYHNALSLTRLRRELPPGGSLWFVYAESPSSFPDKHCFCGHKAKLTFKIQTYSFEQFLLTLILLRHSFCQFHSSFAIVCCCCDTT